MMKDSHFKTLDQFESTVRPQLADIFNNVSMFSTAHCQHRPLTIGHKVGVAQYAIVGA